MSESASYIDSARQTDASAPQSGAEAAADRRGGGRPDRLRWPVRLRWLAVATAGWTGLALAATLAPDPAGAGTHEQLGLPPCEFLARTGWPCPTCGVTTSVAAAVGGNPVAAFKAHPFGLLVVAALLAAAAAGTFAAVSGRPPPRRLRPSLWWAWVAVIAIPASWALKILVGLTNGTLPMR